MTKQTTMPKWLWVLWGIIIAAYVTWMCIGMRFDTYTPDNTLLEKAMYPSPAVYYLWVAGSTIILLLYPLLLSRLLYAKKLTKAHKAFALVSLVLGCAYITRYGFLKNPLEYTASMMGLYYPWLFKGWAVFSGLSIFINTMVMYRKYDYRNMAGVVCTSIGCAALFLTVNIPSAGEDLVMTLQCLAHWSSALVFALLGAAGIVIFLVHQCRAKNKKYRILTAAFVAVLALMLVLLVTVGKNGLIENLPMWAAYIVLALANFTTLLDVPEAAAAITEQ